MRNSVFLLAIGAAAVVIALKARVQREAADLVLIGGEIYTVDAATPRAEAVAIRDGRIIAVGGEAEISKFRGSETVEVDLEGAIGTASTGT